MQTLVGVIIEAVSCALNRFTLSKFNVETVKLEDYEALPHMGVEKLESLIKHTFIVLFTEVRLTPRRLLVPEILYCTNVGVNSGVFYFFH